MLTPIPCEPVLSFRCDSTPTHLEPSAPENSFPPDALLNRCQPSRAEDWSEAGDSYRQIGGVSLSATTSRLPLAIPCQSLPYISQSHPPWACPRFAQESRATFQYPSCRELSGTVPPHPIRLRRMQVKSASDGTFQIYGRTSTIEFRQHMRARPKLLWRWWGTAATKSSGTDARFASVSTVSRCRTRARCRHYPQSAPGLSS